MKRILLALAALLLAAQPVAAQTWIYAGGLGENDFRDGATHSAYQPHNYLYGSTITIPSSGTVTQLSVYASVPGSPGTPVAIKLGLFDEFFNLVEQSTSTITTTDGAWTDSATISASVSAGTYHVFVSAADGTAEWWYSSSDDGFFAEGAYADAMPASLTGVGTETDTLVGVRALFTEASEPEAPVLSAPTPSGTLETQTSAIVGATTDQDSGTLYAVLSTSDNVSEASAAQVKAGQNASSTSADFADDVEVTDMSPEIEFTGLSASTTYYYALVQSNDNGDSNVVAGSFTTADPPPPELSNPTPSGTIESEDSATVGATTDQDSGTLYAVLSTTDNVSEASAAQIKAGENENSDPADFADDVEVEDNSPEIEFTELTANTTYYYALVQSNENGDSNVVSGSFTTAEADIVATKLIFGSQPGNIVVGQTFGAFTVRAVDAEENLDEDFTGDVTITLQVGDGTLGGTLTKAAVAGVATFDDVYINTLNTDAVIRATAAGLTAADSEQFDVTAGGAGIAGFPATSRLGGMLQ